MPESPRDSTASVEVRLKMCRDIMKLRVGMVGAPPATRVRAEILARRRIAALRTVLLNRPGRTMADDVLSPATSMRVLGDVLAGLDGKSRAERVRTATYVRELNIMLSRIIDAEVNSGLPAPEGYSRSQIEQQALLIIQESGESGAVDDAIDEHLKAGDMSDLKPALSAALQASLGAKSSQQLQLEDIDPELAERRKAAVEDARVLEKEAGTAHALYMALRSMVVTLSLEEREPHLEKLAQLREEYEASYARYAERWNTGVVVLDGLVQEAFRKATEAAQRPIVEVGQRAIDDVLSASRISQEEARAWAEKVEITRAAVGRLKKIGYPVEQVRADMAEFYRFTGGRVELVKIDSKGDRRANASDIASHGKTGSVFLDSNFSKKTLWHELAHHLEADPVARRAAGQLVKRRSEDGKAYSLRSLTGNKGYRANEAAYKDGFFHPYVGKIYRDGMTEVFSMGVESFSDPLTLGRRLADDPQTLEFVAGYLKADIEPLARAFMDVRSLMEELNSETMEKEAKGAEKLVEKLAQGIRLDDDTDKSWMIDQGIERWYKGKQIGSWDGWRVIEDRVINYEAGGRKTVGYALIKTITEPDRYFPNDRVRTVRLNHTIATRDRQVLRAALAIFQKTDRFPSASEMNNVAFLLRHVDS